MKRYGPFLLAAALVLAVMALYWQTRSFHLLLVDDDSYITDNPAVKYGLSLQGIKYAFTNSIQQYWIPVTWLSYMVDVSLFGLNPGAIHLANAVYFALNAAALFCFLYLATGSLWKSFVAAALFTLHPMRVESVAWVTERKDMLSGLFILLAFIAYLGYARKGSWLYYALALIAMAVSLMAKPITMVAPFMIMAIDFWPLARHRTENLRKLALEKLPFFALSIAGGLVTLSTQSLSMSARSNVGLLERVSTAIYNYGKYLLNTFWPFNLLMEDVWSIEKPTALLVALSLAVLLAVSWFVWQKRQDAPYLASGWWWFVMGLAPVSGLFMAGNQSYTDRFTYLPHMGLFAALVWGGAELFDRYPWGARAKPLAAALALTVLLAGSAVYIPHWKNTDSLLTYIDYTKGGSSFAKDLSGSLMALRNNPLEAVPYFKEALRITPTHERARYNLGVAYLFLNEKEAAMAEFAQIYKSNPKHYDNVCNYAYTLSVTGDTEGAIKLYFEALALNPKDAKVLQNLGLAYLGKEMYAEAEKHLQHSISLDPNFVQSRLYLGTALMRLGRPGEAATHFAAAVNLAPNNHFARLNLALALEESGDLAGAAERYQELINLDPGARDALDGLMRVNQKRGLQ